MDCLEYEGNVLKKVIPCVISSWIYKNCLKKKAMNFNSVPFCQNPMELLTVSIHMARMPKSGTTAEAGCCF